MLKVGITGGIGSGKSIICEVFKSLNVPVYNADKKAAQLVETNPQIRSEIINEFGDQSYTGSGYNRKYIAEKVFNDKSLLNKLNRIIHPAVAEEFYQWMENYKVPYVIEEAAILFESGANEKMDEVIVVDAPEDLRISRVMRRDGLSRKDIKARVLNQWPTDKLLALADWIIDNSDKTLVLPQILKIHNTLCKRRTV